MSPRLPARFGAELAGTAALVGIGTGAIVLGARAGGVPQWSLAVVWFFALAVPVMAFRRISGAHFNPGITLGLALVRRHPWEEVVPYLGAQFAGAFLGSGAVWFLLGSAADLGATLPKGGLLAAGAGEAAFTFLLGVVVAAPHPGDGWLARGAAWGPSLVVGLSTWTIGPISGSSLNPARSLAPAVLSGVWAGAGIYFVVVPIAAAAGIASAAAWRRRSIADPPPADPS